MDRIFAENAWLGPGQFVKGILIEHDSRVCGVRVLGAGEAPPGDAFSAQWLMPGFINAHCHLEYSWLAGKLPRGRICFGEWMKAIIAARPAGNDFGTRNQAMDDSVRTLIRGGCTTVFDSTTDDGSANYLERSGLRYFLFHEVLGLSQQRAEPIWNSLLQRLENNADCDAPRAGLIGHGINPHAPYSVGPWLREQLMGATASQYPQAWHLAETEDEEMLFRTEKGSIAEFFQSHGLPLPTMDRWRSSFDFLEKQGLLERCSVAFHGNLLTHKEVRYFTGDRIVVHCPATHRWFNRPPVPLGQWLDDGVNVCLGTDSLASSETLSMREILRVTLEDNADVSADQALRMACSNGAKLPFMAGEALTGQLKDGAPADFVAMRIDAPPESAETLAQNDDEQWRQMLCRSQTAVQQVWIAGNRRLA